MAEKLSLDNLGNGAVSELFDNAVKKVVENIKDPNTQAAFKRQIKITVDVKPSKDRKSAETTYKVDYKLAPDAPGETMLYVLVDPETGEFTALQDTAEQHDLFDKPAGAEKAPAKDNVVPMGAKSGGE